MNRLRLLAFTLSLIVPSFTQASFTWNLYDFGASQFDENNNWSPIFYPDGCGNLPYPGYAGEGGEKFDLEALFFAIEGENAFIAITNSFGLVAYSTAWHQTYGLGDIFFGFDGIEYQYAIRVNTGNIYQVDTYMGITYKPGTFYGTLIADQVGPYRITSGTEIGQATTTLTYEDGLETNPFVGDGNTYILEFSFNSSLISEFSSASTISFSVTLESGYDLIQKTVTLIPEYICGDVNNDGVVNILDIIFLIDYKFKGGPAPEIMASADVNSDGVINILDIIYLIDYKFKGGPEPNCM